MTDTVERTRISVAGAEPRLLQAGSTGAREAVVFVHGNPGSVDDWGPLAEAVAATGLRAVALDLPDFGETDAPDGFAHTVSGYAAFLGEAIEALGIDRVHFVIHDFGGPIGLTWARTHLDAVASVTLIDIGILPGYRWHWVARIWRTPVLGEVLQATVTRQAFRWLVNRAEPRGLPRQFVDEMYDHYDRRTRRAVLRLYRATNDIGSAAAEVAEEIAPRDIPALVLWGEKDSYLPAKHAASQREMFPSADIHVLPDSGHWPYVDAPETVERLLIEFLNRVRGQ